MHMSQVVKQSDVPNTNECDEVAPNIWRLTFKQPELVSGPGCTFMFPKLIESSKQHPIGLIGLFPAGMRIFDPSLATAWLNAFVIQGLRVGSIGLVSATAAMRVVLKGSALAMSTLKKPITVGTFETYDDALAWSLLEREHHLARLSNAVARKVEP